MKWGTVLVLALALAGCGDDDGMGDGGGGNDDQGVNTDGGAVDLFGADLTCTYGFFPGFGGISGTERRYDCPCGCDIDKFNSVGTVGGNWNGNNMHATFLPTMNGLEVTADGTQGLPAIGGLSSINPSNQFFLDGDFDMLVDYEIVGAMPAEAHALLQVNNLKMPANSQYTVERDSQCGVAEYTGDVGGIIPVRVATNNTSGTLELKRTSASFTIQAIADGAMITQYTGSTLDRMAILLTAAVDTCPTDGGTGAPAGSFTVRWKNLRLASGSLVDRQN